MAANKVTIDVEGRFIDHITDQVNKANKALDELGKKKPKVVPQVDTKGANQKTTETGKKIDEVGKKKPKPVINVDDQASKKVDRVQRLLNKLDKAYKVAVSIKDGGAAVINGLAKMDSKLKSLTGKTFSVAMKLKDGITSPLNSLKNKIFSIKTLIAGIAGAFAINKTVMQPINIADQYTNAKIGFSTLLGQEGGQQMMNDLDAFAKATPFNTSNVIANSQKMLAMGWQAESIIPDMKTIGDAAAATGKGTEGLDRIILALSQIKTKGKLSTEELNQLAEAGISAKRYLAEGLGYGSGDDGMMKLSKDLQKGAIGADTALQAILSGMKEYDGMMDKMANETVEGLKAQIEDTFEINIARRWGQGLQDGAKKGLGTIVDLLDNADGALESFGDTLYDLGREISNYFANVAENTVGRIKEITESDEFQNASLGEKINMLWEGAIKNPFSDWWKNTVMPWWDTAAEGLAKKADKLGTSIGRGLTAGLVTLLGGDTSGLVGFAEDGVSIGASFAKGFAEGFDGGAITQALVDAVQNVWGMLPTWAKVLVGGKAVLGGASALSTLGGGINALGGLIGKGKGLLGSTGNAMMQGTGLLNILASAGYKLTGGSATAAGYFGGAGMSGGAAAAIGGGTIAGGLVGAGTAFSGAYDLYKGYKDDNETKKQTGIKKVGGVAAGAAIGTMIAPGIGTAIGAGIGGLAGLAGSYFVKKSEAEKAKRLSELQEKSEAGNEQAQKKLEERLAAIDKAYKDSFGDIRMSSQEIESVVTSTLKRSTKEMKKFQEATAQTETAMSTLNSSSSSLNKLSWKAETQGKLSKQDSTTYKETVDTYMAGVKDYIEAKKYEFKTSADLILDLKNDKDGVGKKFVKDTNAMYKKTQKQLSKATKKVETKVDVALKDGKITADEEKIIQEAMAKVTEIKDKIAKAQSDAQDMMIELKFGGGSLTESSYNEMIQTILDNTASKKEELERGIEEQLANLNLTYEPNSEAWQAGYDKIQEDFSEGLKNIELDASNLAFKITGDNFENVLGEDAGTKLQSALSQSLSAGIEPKEWTTEEAQRFLGVDSLTEGMAGAIGQALSALDTSGLTVAPESTEGVARSVVENTSTALGLLLQEPMTGSVNVSGVTPDQSSVDTAASGIQSSLNSKTKSLIESNAVNATQKVNITLQTNFMNSVTKPTVPTVNEARGGVVYPGGRNVARFAGGGMVRGGAQLVTVAEEGTPEMIIPLGSQRRKRGLELWEKAGHMMGVPGFANGGIVGGDEDAGIRNYNSGGSPAPSTGQGVQVNVGGVTVEVNVNGGEGANISQAIAAQGQEIAETVAGILADAFNSQFANTPSKGIA